MKRLFTTLVMLLIAVPIFAEEISFEYKKNIPTKLKIEGRAEQIFWIGISFYPFGVKDGLTEGLHLYSEVNVGKFSETIEIDKKFYGGSYEIAFWGKKLTSEDCKNDDCKYWIKKRGFYFDQLNFYKTGYFNGY